jgi:nucleoid-associated protein YgaU
LLFDTYDTPDATKTDVREYTKKLFHLTTVEQHGDKHRPPVYRLAWGAVGIFFQGVLERLEQQFTLFMEDGTPVRSTSKCTFKEWITNYEDLNKQALESSDIVKTRTLKRGETLSSIAAEEYRDPTLWRLIARENGIDDPRGVAPGTKVLIPTFKRSTLSPRTAL